jgi:hypothetical protein
MGTAQGLAKIKDSKASLQIGIGWGLIGGLAATLAMDLILMGLLGILGLPPFTCFVLVGDTVARMLARLGIDLDGGIALGITAHYIIGPLMGGLFGAAVVSIRKIGMEPLKRGMVSAILFAEILSQPMLVLPPLLLEMTAADTLKWFGGSFCMHLLWGCVVGLVMNWGLRSAALNLQKRSLGRIMS